VYFDFVTKSERWIPLTPYRQFLGCRSILGGVSRDGLVAAFSTRVRCLNHCWKGSNRNCREIILPPMILCTEEPTVRCRAYEASLLVIFLKLRQRIRIQLDRSSPPPMPERKSVVRCPYCVEGQHFKIMLVVAGGDWHKCERCGHVIYENDPSFQCACGKCYDLNGLINVE